MNAASEAYLDLGSVERSWPRSYNRVIAWECPTCAADPWHMCVNPITGLARKMPCVARLVCCPN